MYNYAVDSLSSLLSGKAIIETNKLQRIIETLGQKRTLYHCINNLEKRDTFVGYKGLVSPVYDTIHLDLDSKDDLGQRALLDTQSFSKALTEANCEHVVYFSGNKGFHIAIHKTAFGLYESSYDSEYLQDALTKLAKKLKQTYSTLDTGIFNTNRKFRAWRSVHEKSGLYKIHLSKETLGLNIETIREKAKTQDPGTTYQHPLPPIEPVSWLNVHNVETMKTNARASSKATTLSEPQSGTMILDASLKYKNFKEKKCITEMLNGTIFPQFNRHDIELCLIYELRQRGEAFDKAIQIMDKWAHHIYGDDDVRIKDTRRQVLDAYERSIANDELYQFGCYGAIKQAYCSARCKIYDSLDRTKRAEALDCSLRQKKENELRHHGAEQSEGELADSIISKMPELCKSNGQYFQWIGTHWKRIDGDMFEDSLVKVAMSAYDNQAPIRKVKALAEHVISKIPIAPETNHFFIASPCFFNFTDCTAEIVSRDNGTLALVTKEHSKKDYLSYCAPFPLKAPHSLPKGTAFKSYMDARFQDVGEDGLKVIKQMLGAALIPYIPRIFFIEGVTNSGKSTLAKLIQYLLGKENVSSVLPIIKKDGGERFRWEAAVGKLANIVLELPKNTELDVNTLKMVRDKEAFHQDRKNKGAIRATLPFLHIYCCNQMPLSFEGNSGALDNRISMLFFKQSYLNGASGIMELAETIWSTDSGSVLEAAREGLEDLIKDGFKYFESRASNNAKKDWQIMTDTISQYFEDCNSGEWIEPDWDGKKYELGKIIYDNFRNWARESGCKTVGKKRFYKELETRLGVSRKHDAQGGERFDFSTILKSRNLNNYSGQKTTSDTFPNPLSY